MCLLDERMVQNAVLVPIMARAHKACTFGPFPFLAPSILPTSPRKSTVSQSAIVAPLKVKPRGGVGLGVVRQRAAYRSGARLPSPKWLPGPEDGRFRGAQGLLLVVGGRNSGGVWRSLPPPSSGSHIRRAPGWA